MSIIGFLKGYTLPNDGHVVTEIAPGGPSPTGTAAAVIFRPGAPSAGYFVATWAEVQAAIAAAAGCITIYIDTSLAPAHVPTASGVTNGQGRAMLALASTNFAGGGVGLLTVDDGATLFDFHGWEFVTVECDTQGPVPALDFTFAGATPGLVLAKGAGLTNATTATAPSIVIPAGGGLIIGMRDGSRVFQGAGVVVPLVHLAAATSTLLISAGDCAVQGNICDGLGGFIFEYDSDTLTSSGGVPPVTAATVVTQQIDTHTVVLDFIANATNVLAALQGAGVVPLTGDVTVFASGYGGGSSGSGGATGALGAGDGGTGGNGSWWSQDQVLQVDVAQPLDVAIGIGAPPVPADTVGTDGRSTMVTGNGGQTLLTMAGAHVLEGAGIGSFGGVGGTAGNPGAGGQHNFFASQGDAPLGPPTGLWPGGAGGAGNAGGGGGGAGGGPRGSAIGGATGGSGGTGATAGNPGSPGVDAVPNTGAGGGGGGGGDAGQPGGMSGAGGSGWLRLTIVVP